MVTRTVYVSIGNSDDKLTQQGWSDFWEDVDHAITRHPVDQVDNGVRVIGVWHSAPAAPYQNACWCIQIEDQAIVERLRSHLRELCGEYGQDSIAWATADTEFLKGTE